MEEKVMTKTYIANAFSLNMLAPEAIPGSAKYEAISQDEAQQLAVGAQSIVGHPDTAAALAVVLGVAVTVNRVTVALKKGDRLLVGQYSGDRLPEGTKVLPAGATLKLFLVTIE